MHNGLKYLQLSYCGQQDLSHLAVSNHSKTLLQLELTGTPIDNDSAAAGFISLCQSLTNVKVIIVLQPQL